MRHALGGGWRWVWALANLTVMQGGRCAICADATGSLQVDHCHETDEVRGGLCRKCNCSLSKYERGYRYGGVRDAQFAAYLTAPPARDIPEPTRSDYEWTLAKGLAGYLNDGREAINFVTVSLTFPQEPAPQRVKEPKV